VARVLCLCAKNRIKQILKGTNYITKHLTEDRLQWLIVLFCLLSFVGFVGSRAMASIGMIGILASVLLSNGIINTLKKYFQSKEMLALSLFFWLVFLSGTYSEHKSDWLEWVRIKLPYLALPLAFAPLKKLDERKFILLLYGFMLIFFISTAVVLGNYFLHYETITGSFRQGGTIPMPFSHIRYTLMLAFSFFCGLYLMEKRYYIFSKNERWLQIVYCAFVFIALHILTVRSGLLALYLGLMYLAIDRIIRQRKFVIGITLILVIMSLPFAAYRWVPSFHNKIDYMNYDLSQYQKGEINEYSDAMRILSMKIGWDIWLDNMWLGVGAGDLKSETDKSYIQNYPQISEYNWRLPHNQFIWVLASTGIIGLVLFLTAFFFPFLVNGNFKFWLLTVFYLMIFSSFFTEDTVEEQIGTGFYIIFLLVLMNHHQRE